MSDPTGTRRCHLHATRHGPLSARIDRNDPHDILRELNAGAPHDSERKKSGLRLSERARRPRPTLERECESPESPFPSVSSFELDARQVVQTLDTVSQPIRCADLGEPTSLSSTNIH